MTHRTLTARTLQLTLLALGIVLLAGCSTAPAVRSTPDQAVLANPAGVTLPTRRCANYFLLDAYLNGRGPFTLALDTGASQTVVTPRIADLLKDDARPVDLYAEGSQGKRQDVNRVVRIREMRVGDVQLRGFDAITLDLRKIQASLGTNVEGILGYPAFADVLLTIDYPNSTVRLAKGQLPPPDGRGILELADDDRPMLLAQIDGRPRRLLIDTGKAGGFSLRNFDDLRFANPPATIALGMAIGGSYVLRAGRLSGDIALGDVTFRHPIVESSDASDLIGAEALGGFAVVLDSRHRRASLVRTGERIVECPPIRGIGVGFDFTHGSWEVSQVFSGQPAEAAGIQPGDAVIRLGTRRTRELACTRPLDAFDAGDSIDVAIIRQRRRMDFKIPIITLVP